MDQIKSLLNLPIETLVVLAAGYLGYKIAFTGKDRTHKPVDTVFISLAFGLVAKLTYGYVISLDAQPSTEAQTIRAAITSIAAGMIAASIWRKWGEDTLQGILRMGAISYSDGTVSAWDAIRVSTKTQPTQLIVRKHDGSQLMCDNLSSYEDFPHGPCIYGADGSIALYVNYFRNSAVNNWIENDPIDEDFGAIITYIPANQIAEIEIRNIA